MVLSKSLPPQMIIRSSHRYPLGLLAHNYAFEIFRITDRFFGNFFASIYFRCFQTTTLVLRAVFTFDVIQNTVVMLKVTFYTDSLTDSQTHRQKDRLIELHVAAKKYFNCIIVSHTILYNLTTYSYIII